MRTLFIGNSHTFYNDMPNIFKEICKENGIDMQVSIASCPNTPLKRFRMYKTDLIRTQKKVCFSLLLHYAH